MSVLLEKILSRGNMYMALDKVKANKGAGGIDEYSAVVRPQIWTSGTACP